MCLGARFETLSFNNCFLFILSSNYQPMLAMVKIVEQNRRLIFYDISFTFMIIIFLYSN